MQVRAAITAGVRVGGVDLGRSTALHWAARKGHLGVATVLVSKGASLLKKTKLGKKQIYAVEDRAPRVYPWENEP